MATENFSFKELSKINLLNGIHNLDNVRNHIIDCIIKLKNLKDLLVENENEKMKHHVFLNAVQLLVEEDKTHEADVELLRTHFAEERKTCSTCNWCPLLWAIALKDRIKENVVHALFLASPDCLIHRLVADAKPCPKPCPGFTPVDLLVMQKNPNMSLLRYFDLRSPKVFTSPRVISHTSIFPLSLVTVCNNREVFPLHIAAAHSENVELLQYLIQTHPDAATWNPDHEYSRQWFPLSYLVMREDFPTFHPMLQCLLDASSDSDVIGHAIFQVLCKLGGEIENTARILELLKILLTANPGAAIYYDYEDETVFHAVGTLEDPICALSVMKMLLVHYPLGLEETADNKQYLPIHYAVEYSTVEVVKFMLRIYPDSIKSKSEPGLMHRATLNDRDAGMVPYLCSVAPQLLHDTYEGLTPLTRLCRDGFWTSGAIYPKVLAMCETDLTIVKVGNPWLPIHYLMDVESRDKSPTSDFADCFRLLLRLYPSSAQLLTFLGGCLIDRAIVRLDDYFVRLLLSASTKVKHMKLLLDYNHECRRELLFLSFIALSRSPQPTIFAMLRQSHRDLLKVVASFL